MLKEVVDLVAKSSRANADLLFLDKNGECAVSWEDCNNAIRNLTDAIGRHDDNKRKTDEAICLLFRAFHEVQNDSGFETAQEYIDRAERLLGFASLEPAKA